MKRVLLLSLLVIFSSCEKDPIQYSLSISPNPPIGGYVNPRTGTYNAGETVSILASPNQFYGFKNWSEDGMELHHQLLLLWMVIKIL